MAASRQIDKRSGNASKAGAAGKSGKRTKSARTTTPAKPPKNKKGERKAFLLRLPPDLMNDLRGWASQDLRSLNSHIEYLLRDALRRRKGG